MLTPIHDRDGITIYNGDCRSILPQLPERSVNCCVTSPPYWGLRDYGHEQQIGLEATPDEFVAEMVSVFREVRRVLQDDGTLWLNLGDTYHTGDGYRASPTGSRVKQSVINYGHDAADLQAAPNRQRQDGLKPKDMVGIPWRVAFALQADGWYLRQDIIWSKPNPMPESVTDRCTKSHEYIFLLSKSERYYFDSEAIQEPAVCGSNGSEFHTGKTGEHQLGRSQKVRPSKAKGSFNGKTEAMAETGQNAFRAVTETRNKRDVWVVPIKPYKEAHFATFPKDLIKPCILAGSPENGTVIDPFWGSGTTGEVCLSLGRKCIGTELNPKYCKLSFKRFAQPVLPFGE
jgi:DNA modification methylase